MLPQQINQEAIRAYNKFPKEKRDMTQAEFVKCYAALNDQAGVERDLSQILHGRSQQRVIDTAVRGGQDG